MKEETGSQKELTALEQQQEQFLSDLEHSTSMEKVRKKPKVMRSPKARSRKSSPKARKSPPSPEKQKQKKSP